RDCLMIVSEPKAQPSISMRFLMRVGDEAIWPPGHGGQYPEYKQAVPIPSSPVPSCNIKYNTTVGEIRRICVTPTTVHISNIHRTRLCQMDDPPSGFV